MPPTIPPSPRVHLAVICDSETTRHDPFIAGLLEHIMENGNDPPDTTNTHYHPPLLLPRFAINPTMPMYS